MYPEYVELSLSVKEVTLSSCTVTCSSFTTLRSFGVGEVESLLWYPCDGVVAKYFSVVLLVTMFGQTTIWVGRKGIRGLVRDLNPGPLAP